MASLSDARDGEKRVDDSSTHFMISVETPSTTLRIPSISSHVLIRFLDIFNIFTPVISSRPIS